MTRDQLVGAVTAYLRGEFGRMLDVRDARLERRVAGNTWVVEVVVASQAGDIPVAEVEVDETGLLTPALAVDDVVTAIRRPPPAADRQPEPASAGPRESLMLDSLLDLEAVGAEAPEPPDSIEGLRARVASLLSKADDDALREARDLMPRLLTDPDTRGGTLVTMAKVEARLGENKLALGYLEAAARELADRFDLSALEQCAALAMELTGKEAFGGTAIHALLDRSRARLRPLASLFDAPSLSAVSIEQRTWLGAAAALQTLSPGECLVREGEPSRSVFVIKSGILAVVLETPGGGQRTVRCCFPGWLLGESSVLIEGDPRCTATLCAERVSEVWVLDAAVLGAVMAHNEALRERIAATKQIHRIDSFFSMHETMGQLDVQVRDEMLGCIKRILTFDEDTVLVPAGEVPAVACLVARGELALYDAWDLRADPIAVIGADQFYGVRDAVHQIPAARTAVARVGSTIALFDAVRLRAMGERSPDHVVAVLERLG